MSEPTDTSNVVIRPPIAWALAFVAGLGVDWLYPLPSVPTSIPRSWVGGGVFAIGLALAIWAIVTISKAGSPKSRRRRLSRMDPTASLATRSTSACSLGRRGWQSALTIFGCSSCSRHSIWSSAAAWSRVKKPISIASSVLPTSATSPAFAVGYEAQCFSISGALCVARCHARQPPRSKVRKFGLADRIGKLPRIVSTATQGEPRRHYRVNPCEHTRDNSASSSSSR
jgi:hypothetical protein